MPSGNPIAARIEGNVAAQGTASTTQTTVIAESPAAGVVSAASITPNAAVTGHATNYRTFTLTNKGQAGAGTTAIGTFATSSTPANDLTASDERALTLSSTASDLVVAEGDVLAVVETVAASGVAHGGYRVQVEITRS
jgi:hypothetical protein